MQRGRGQGIVMSGMDEIGRIGEMLRGQVDTTWQLTRWEARKQG